MPYCLIAKLSGKSLFEVKGLEARGPGTREAMKRANGVLYGVALQAGGGAFRQLMEACGESSGSTGTFADEMTVRDKTLGSP